MVQTAENPAISPAAEQHFILHGLTWHQFKAIQASFEIEFFPSGSCCQS